MYFENMVVLDYVFADFRIFEIFKFYSGSSKSYFKHLTGNP